MTDTQYWWLFGILIFGAIGYIILLTSKMTDDEEDAHCQMIETRKEFMDRQKKDGNL